MDFLKKNKMTLAGGAGMVALLYVYLTYFSGGSAPLTATSPDQISGDILVTLNSLHTIKLDNGIFSDPVFVSLSDYGVTIPPQDAGRRNPFAPVGSASSPSTPTAPPKPTH